MRGASGVLLKKLPLLPGRAFPETPLKPFGVWGNPAPAEPGGEAAHGSSSGLGCSVESVDGLDLADHFVAGDFFLGCGEGFELELLGALADLFGSELDEGDALAESHVLALEFGSGGDGGAVDVAAEDALDEQGFG